MKIIIFTCDKYARCIPIFYHFWKKNWPDCPYPLLIVTGEQKIELPDDPSVSVVYQGADKGYASNAKNFLSTFPDEVCLLIMDDYVLRWVNTSMIERAEQLCRQQDIGCVRLVAHPGPTLPFGEPGFGEIDKRAAEYAVSLQATIWKRRVFMGLLEEGESAWATETSGTVRVRNKPGRFLGVEEPAMEYLHYCREGESNPHDNPEVVQWVKDHWDDPPAAVGCV